MAGIGFELRKLTRQRNLSGVTQAHLYSSMIIAGPWLLTVLCIGLLSYLASRYMESAPIAVFRLIIIYNFGFSLVFTGPVMMVVTRCLADSLYTRQLDGACSMLLGALMLVAATQLPLVSGFYFAQADLSDGLRLAAIVNYSAISMTWLVMVFLTTLKAYRLVGLAFLLGLAASVALALLAARFESVALVILAFTIGLVLALSILLAGVFSEYPVRWVYSFRFLRYFKSHWELALGGLLYNAAIWVDKWIMWFAPEAVEIVSGMPSYPVYDSAMFYAFISIVPALSVFVLTLETSFFERYLEFFRDIKAHASLEKIRRNHQRMMTILHNGARNVFVIQLVVSICVILTAPKIIEYIGADYAQISILRFGALGAMFHVFQALMIIVIYYFDYRRVALYLVVFYLLTNILFTLISIEYGFAYYGGGFFISALGSFVVSSLTAAWCLENVPYYTFIGNNSSIKR